MFLALRDLRAARGRFVLITLVVAMVALLVSFLSGLTAGLSQQNISAVESIDSDRVVFADTGADPSFDSSVLTADQIATWRDAGGSIDPIGISRSRAEHGTAATPPSQVAVFGADGQIFGDRSPGTPGTVVLSTGAATELAATEGDEVDLGGRSFTVAAIRGDDWYSHTPVVWTTLPDWRSVSPRSGEATILAVSGVAETGAVDSTAATTTIDTPDAVSAIGSYDAENGSLNLMTVLLFAISALVIGAFFTVWTIQRLPDIATLKALGATSASLVRDALGQAVVVLAVGVAAGLGITVVAATLIGDALPFIVDTSTTLLPAGALIVLGLAGAAFALRFLFTTDPLTALNAAR